MITEKQIEEAIAEMQGQRHPNADTCVKLASYYTIRNEMFPKENAVTIDNGYSRAPAPADDKDTIDLDSETDFAEAINGKSAHDVLKKLEEIMSALYVINPPLYRKIIRELNE